MFHSRSFLVALSCSAVIVGAGLIVHDARAQGGKALMYQFKAGETYMYAVTIVCDRPDAVATYEGYIDIVVKTVGPTGAAITPHATLPGKTKSKVAAAGKGFKGKGGPGSSGNIPITFSPGKGVVGAREVTFDSYGNVVTMKGDIGLSYLLGSVSRLVVEPLSRTGEKNWQRSNDVTLQEVESFGPFGKGPSNTKSSSAKEVVTYEIVGSMDTLVRIKKTSDFQTVAGGADAPRVAMRGSGELVFDTKQGMMKSGAYQATLTFNEGNVSASVPITVSYRLLDAEQAAVAKKERDERLNTLKNIAKARADLTPITDDEITKNIEEVKAGKNKMVFAAARLAKAAPVDERRADVLAALEEHLKSTDNLVRSRAASAYCTWATEKNLPTLVGLLKDTNSTTKGEALAALSEFKNPKVADTVATALGDLGMRTKAAAALIAMGPVAEKSVWPYLKHQTSFVRQEACKVLAEIGTKQSIPALKTLAADRTTAADAAAAIQAIQARK